MRHAESDKDDQKRDELLIRESEGGRHAENESKKEMKINSCR